MLRSSDVCTTRSAAGLGRSMREARATRIAKAAHLAFVLAGRLVAVLRTVVYAGRRFDENVLYISELGNVSLRCRVNCAAGRERSCAGPGFKPAPPGKNAW